MVAPVLSIEDTLALLRPVEGPQDPLPSEVPVAIIGAGPAGLTAANLLGRFGVRTLVLERNRTTSDLPKAIVVDDEYMRLLSRLGLAIEMEDHVSKPFGVHFTSPFGFVLAKVPAQVTPNGFGARNAVCQPMFEKILLKSAQRFPNVACAFETQVTGLSQGDTAASIEVTRPDGSRHVVRAQYVLACDGARSFVRTHLGIPFEGASLDQPHLVVDLAEVPDQVPYSRFLCNPRRPLNSVLGPYGGRRLEFMLLPGDDHATIASDQSIRRLVDLHTPYKGMPLKIIRRAIYGLAERMAAQLREGRVFLLGDAAHIMPPFGAQGMNTGARDAANLTWKIAGVLDGSLPVSALESYDLERREHIRQIIDYSVRIGKLANIRFWPAALLRDAAFAAANLVPAVRSYFSEMRYLPKPFIREGLLVHESGAKESIAGRVFPNWTLRQHEGGEGSIDASTAIGWAVVGVGVPRQTLAALAQTAPFDRLKPNVLSIGAGEQFDASMAPGSRMDCFDALCGSVVILRPDNIVAGVANAGDLGPLATNLAKRLS